MCLAKAFLNKMDGESILEDIAHMRLFDDRLELETLMGEKKIISGKVVEIDFATSKILLDNRREIKKSS